MKEGERLFDVGVKPDGKLINIKEEIAEDKLPKAVKEGLQKKYPGAKIVETEKVIVIDGKKEKVTYELKIKVRQEDPGSRARRSGEGGRQVTAAPDRSRIHVVEIQPPLWPQAMKQFRFWVLCLLAVAAFVLGGWTTYTHFTARLC